MKDQRIRLQNLLRKGCSTSSLLELATAFKAEGATQAAMHRLFEEYRRQYEDGEDEATYESILEVLDIIAGWCPPEHRLFETELPM